MKIVDISGPRRSARGICTQPHQQKDDGIRRTMCGVIASYTVDGERRCMAHAKTMALDHLLGASA